MANGFGERSPLGRLYDLDASVLLLGVGHANNTSLHLADYRSDIPKAAVEDLNRRMLTCVADVRDSAQLDSVVADGIAEFGRIDIVCANAGIASFGPAWELSEEVWQEMIDINLTGVWKTVKATVPALISQGTGGSIILTSSVTGLMAFPQLAHYTAAKHGVTGLMRTLAVELAPYGVRVNSVHPRIVDTPMVSNEPVYSLFLGGLEGATRADAEVGMKAMHALPIPWVDPVDVSNAVLWLASDEARYVTGTTQVIDVGVMAPFKIPYG